MRRIRPLLAITGACLTQLTAGPVINEIFYRPGTGYPENTALEFVEIHNPDPVAADLSGWALTRGVDFVFPPGTILQAGGYLVVAADPVALATATGLSGSLGPWEAGDRLSNSGETVTLSRVDGSEADTVTYADEGDWAFRTWEPLGGWKWITQTNGGGTSLERRNPRLSLDNGQNWGDSGAVDGSPGMPNSLLDDDIAPVVHRVRHSPAIPRSTDVVTVSCELADELPAGPLAATLCWRIAGGSNPGAFQRIPMANDGSGRFSAALGAMPDQTVVEFYIEAGDGTLTRTWPAPTSQGQNANCMFQVDDEVDAAASSTYRLVLTGPENEDFEDLADRYTPTVNPASIEDGDRRFNMTLVARDGSETVIRYRADMRIRGASSRRFIHKPLRISLPTDDAWGGVTAFNLNPKFPWLQFAGMRLFQATGLAAPNAAPVEVRRNGEESSTGSGTNPDYGQWVRVEALDGSFADRNWPESDTQLYRKGDLETDWDSNYPVPTTPDDQYSGWLKRSQSGANDWSDLVAFIELWQTLAAPYFNGEDPGDVASGTWNKTPFSSTDLDALAEVPDLDQIARWFAVMTILANRETSLSNGVDDDYAGVFVSDGIFRRLQFIPHDLDTVLGQGDNTGAPSAGGLYNMTDVGAVFDPLLPLFGDADDPGNAVFLDMYHTAIRECFGGVFDADTTTNPYPPFHAFIDNHLGGWVPAEVRDEMKSYMASRQNYLLGQIGAPKITPPPPGSTGTLHSPPGPGLRINEVLAVNVSTRLVAGTYPDLIEIHNSSGSNIPLAGHVLADSSNDYIFPPGSGNVPAGGYALIHSNTLGFGLDAGGDSVQLRNPAGDVLDEVTFGPQVADLSIARTLSDPETWALAVPTPDDPNGDPPATGSPAGLAINEWAGNPDHRLDDDFIELHNPGTEPVALGNLRITDHLSAYPSRYVFPELSFIGAGAFLVIDSGQLGFGLDGRFENIWLCGDNGTVIRQVPMISQGPDASTGLDPDGGANWTTYPVPTPGQPNATTFPGGTVLFENLRITEVMYAPASSGDFEFVELQNIGTLPLELDGVRFTSGISYTFGSGSTLAPGAFVVVCKNRISFLNRYPGMNAVLAPGVFTGSLSNEGERLDLTLPAPAQLNILSFAYSPAWYPLTAGGGRSLHTRDPLATAPSHWGDSVTWAASSALHGSPGAAEPPVITSTTVAGALVDAAFSHVIAATGAPSVFGAAGLPPGLAVAPSTGLISGTPETAGTFPVEVSATGPAGTATATLLLTVLPVGPLDHFSWDEVPASARAGTSFPVRISARDADGRLVEDMDGPVSLSAFVTAEGASPVLITEVTDGDEDQFELQNVTGSTIDTDGWFVVIGDTSNIQTRNPSTYPLPSLLTPGATLRISESNSPGRLFFGSSIAWSDTNPRGWIMLFDASNTLRDFVAFGQWTATALTGLSVQVGGQSIAPVALGQWSGAAIPGDPAEEDSNFWQRVGSTDSNSAAGWTWSLVDTSLGTVNPGLELPWVVDVPLALTPATVELVNGVFHGIIRVAGPGSPVTLQALDEFRHSGESAMEILPFVDADLDGVPDDWEAVHGMSSSDPADALLDSDGDGQNNRSEFQAGTDPLSAASLFAITRFDPEAAANTVSLDWSAVAGKYYRVTSSSDLQSWTPHAGRLATATGTESADIPSGTGTPRFFRVEVEP